MLTGKETNTVYLSEKLQSDFTESCNALIKILEKYSIKYHFLKETKDIWCRDYMPIQIKKGKFIQFRYEPSYLNNKDDIRSRSIPKKVCKANNIIPKFSKINLDGGNVVNWSDRAIITDRVFCENPEYSDKAKLISEIEHLLEVEIIVIPQIKSDMTGHADGMVRFVDQNTILGNDRDREYKYWKKGINKVLKEKGINYIDVPFLEHKEKGLPNYHAIGCYVNYLEVGNLIVLPIFEVKENRDQKVLDKFKSIFPDRNIETINFNEVGKEGGLLNCVTWTIQK